MKKQIARLAGLLTGHFLERRLGINTVDIVELRNLGIDPQGRSNYIPSGWRTMKYIAATRPINSDDVFVDFGSGKGRMLILAARYPFRRVIGVELSRELHEIARANVAQTGWRHRSSAIDLYNCDASEWTIPDEMTFAYFFNPFTGAPFERVVDNIGLSYKKARRRVTIFYANPVMHDYLSSRDWLRPVAYVPGSVAVYETA